MFSLRVLVIVFHFSQDTPQTTHDLGQRNRCHEGQDITFERILIGCDFDTEWKALVLANIEIIVFPDYQNLPAEFAISFCYFDRLNNTCSRFLRVFFIPFKISILKMRRQNAFANLKYKSWENASHRTHDVQGSSKSRISYFVYPCITA